MDSDGHIPNDRMPTKADSDSVYTKTEMNTKLNKKANTTDVYTKTDIDSLLDNKQDKLTFDNTPTFGSNNPVTSTGIKSVLSSLSADFGDVKSSCLPRTTASGYPVILTDYANYQNIISCKVYGNEGGVGDLNETTGKYEIPVKIQGKNLINFFFNFTDGTRNGVTITSSFGTISVSGTPTGSIACYLGQVDIVPGTSYCLSGIDVGKNLAFTLVIYSSDGTQISQKSSRLINFTAENNAAYVKIYIDRLSNNVEIPSTVVKPQLEIGSSATEFEIGGDESTMTLELDAPLGVGESAWASADKLEGFETGHSSINRISCGTTVAPSKINIQYYQDINKVIAEIKAAILSNGGNV